VQLVERFDQADIVSVMTEAEARATEAEIIKTGDRLRMLLVDFNDRQGYRALGYTSYTAWGEVIAPRIFGMTRRRLAQELTAAVIERELGTMVPNSESIPERQLRPLSAFIERPRGPGADDKPFEINGEAIRAAWDEANYRSGGHPTARDVERVVDEMLSPEDDALDPPMEETQAADLRAAPRINAGMFTSATPEWYTPRHVIDRVLKVFGEIDLDPCSNSTDPDIANVPANDHYTDAMNGLAWPWHGRVYMNPPYGDEIGQWTARLIEAYEAGEIDEAIALLPARTDTAWFRPLMKHRCCFVHGRLKFSGSENSAPFPSVVVYLGPDLENFIEFFGDIGTIMEAA
jgi:DNA N-6-adenine-methyltransferase Dam